MATNSARSKPKLWLVSGSAQNAAVAAAPALDDSELLLALRRGDETAATALHDRVRPQVDRTIRRLLGPHDFEHEDVAQLAMIQLVSTIDRYRGDCSLDSWTSTITAHVVYKHIRRRKTERRIFGALDADLLAETRSSSRTGREALVRNLMGRVHSHMIQIEESKAWAFVLHDVCGYDLREIAKITGVSIAAAQTRLVRGRREMHERIASDPELANLLESVEGEL
ncbi:MAG: RNA polymerase sigma factor [Polyangiaceae bacterium]|jgi:RNA polymerase sigma-70 factor (ECF subfamily)